MGSKAIVKRLKTKHGFTIVEVLVTTIVIIILGTVTVVSYDNVQSEARDKTRLSNANIIAQGLENYYNKNGEYPSVASIVGQTGSSVQQKLDLRNADVLVLPGAAPGTTNSFTQDNPSATEYAYNGESTTESEASQCISDPNGGCDQFDLQWQNEAGVVQEIQSIHQGRTTTGNTITVPAPPSAPDVTVAYNSPDIVATVTAVTCESGTTPEYKILRTSNTNGSDPVFPAWSTVSWQTSLTKSVTPVQGTYYYFKAIAHCVNTTYASDDSDESDIADFFYATTGTPVVTATVSGTSVSVTVTPVTCPAGTTAKYQIYEQKDTTSATGTMAVISTRNFTTVYTYSGTAGPTTSPTKNTYKAYTRCDSTSAQGVVSPSSATATVVSAPVAPTLTSNAGGATSGYANAISWSWSMPANSCPVGTTPTYNYVWTGDYVNAGTGSTTTGTAVSLTTSTQGYNYGLHVRASCGSAITDKVLQGAFSNNVTYLRNIDSQIWVYQGSIRARRPDSTHPNVVYGQASINSTRNVAYNGGLNTSTPNTGYPGAGNCAAGLTRRFQWQWAYNQVGSSGWEYAGSGGAWSPVYSWADGVGLNIPSGSNTSDYSSSEHDLDAGDKYEIRFNSWCQNLSTGRSGPNQVSDNFGNLTTTTADGDFHTFCAAETEVPYCYGWHSAYNPLSSHTGRNSANNASGPCTVASDSGNSANKYCFSPVYSKNGTPWGW